MALTDSVSSEHAPIPSNDSEQLFFRAIFQTLVRVDCEGRVHPEAALAWRADTGRRVWIFTLRDSSSSKNASSAADAVARWRSHPGALAAVGIEDASVQPDGRLRVTLRGALDSVPRLFADPALAVSQSGSNSEAIEYRVNPGADPRDILDQGADLMVTRDPTLVEYAAGKPGVATFPLPWSRTYLLLQPPGADPLPRAVDPDAVRVDARAAEPPFWWTDRRACGDPPTPASSPASNRVAFVRGDHVAQSLAERIVALATPGADLRTAPLEAAEFAASLGRGSERAYIVMAPRQSLAPCRDSADWPAGAALHALIDTRAHVIVRRGAPPLGVDWDGAVRLLPHAEPTRANP